MDSAKRSDYSRHIRFCEKKGNQVRIYPNPGPRVSSWRRQTLLQTGRIRECIKPLVYCVGPGALILGSVDMGPAHEKENLDKLKKALGKLLSDTELSSTADAVLLKNVRISVRHSACWSK